MGDMADMIIQDGMDFTCPDCGHSREWCDCLQNLEKESKPPSHPYPGPSHGWENKPKPKKHMNGCVGKPVRYKNQHTGFNFIGCSQWPKCKFSRDLKEGE